MRLYICYGLFPSPRPGGHPCRNAHRALVEAGHDPEVVKTYGLGPLPDALNPKRRRVRELTGSNWVPVLETGDGTVIDGSQAIVEWARQHPAA